jgi:hypothetical protein
MEMCFDSNSGQLFHSPIKNDHKIGLQEKRQFFKELAKIVENSDLDNGPRKWLKILSTISVSVADVAIRAALAFRRRQRDAVGELERHVRADASGANGVAVVAVADLKLTIQGLLKMAFSEYTNVNLTNNTYYICQYNKKLFKILKKVQEM